MQDAVDRGWFRETCSIVTGVPNVRSILETIRDIAAGMAHMHDRGVVHGDMTGALPGQCCCVLQCLGSLPGAPQIRLTIMLQLPAGRVCTLDRGREQLRL